MQSVAVLVPVKAFAQAKERLAPVLSGPERQALARDLATRVVTACAPLPVAVVCDDPAVAEWARREGLSIVWRPGFGLNAAVDAGVRALGHHDRVVISHGDLPQPAELATIGSGDGITLVPDRQRDGTNVIVLPPRCGFSFSYGPGSFSRHLEHARRFGLPVQVREDTLLSYDIDTPEDLGLIDLRCV